MAGAAARISRGSHDAGDGLATMAAVYRGAKLDERGPPSWL